MYIYVRVYMSIYVTKYMPAHIFSYMYIFQILVHKNIKNIVYMCMCMYKHLEAT